MAEIGSFRAMAVQSQVDLLTQIRSALDAAPLSSRDQFTDLMKAAFLHCRLDARALSDDMGYNFSTVHRWIDGRTAPHPSLWPRINDWIKSALEARIDTLRPIEASEATEA